MAVETRVGWTVKTMAKTARMELGPIGQALVRLAAIQSAAMRTATKTDQWMTLNQDVQRATSMVDGKPCQTSPGRCTTQTSLAFACQAGFAQTPSNQTAAASPLRVQKWADLQLNECATFTQHRDAVRNFPVGNFTEFFKSGNSPNFYFHATP